MFVLLLVVVDITILSIFIIVEHAYNQLNSYRVSSQEMFEETVGVSF